MEQYSYIVIEGTKFLEILWKYRYILRLLKHDELTEEKIVLDGGGGAIPPECKEEIISCFISELASLLRYKDYNELIKMKKELEANSDEILATLKTVEWVYIYEGEGDCATIVCNTIRYGFTNGHEYHNEHTQVY